MFNEFNGPPFVPETTLLLRPQPPGSNRFTAAQSRNFVTMAAGGRPDMRHVLEHCKVGVTGVCESDDPASDRRCPGLRTRPSSSSLTCAARP